MPGYRGRLIWPMFVDVEQIDTDATRTTDPDGPGPLTSGYDDDFMEPVIVPATEESPGIPQTGAPRGTLATVYKTPVLHLPAQIEVVDFDKLRQFISGNVPSSEVKCVFHFRDLEAQGLIDANGEATIRPHDRLRAIYDKNDVLIISIPETPGLYAIADENRSFGLTGGTRNLFLVTFQDREEGAES